LLHQKYLYLFWVLVLQVPLLKVAIDRRSRPKAPARVQAVRQRQPRLYKQAVARVEQLERVTDAGIEAIVPSAETPPSETYTRAADFDLSQADNQIAQIKAILASAVRNRVSDIHLEPTTEGLRVRYRIDGILRDVTMLPLAVSRRTIVALKVMADMDISESRRPQDARISEQYTSTAATNLDLDLRVSTLPCIGGEKAVIRLLPRQNPFSNMDDLGFTEKALALYQSWLQQPQGMIIFTGPTGSGKTSTLYTSLQAIATEHVNVVTVEDPVEYILPSITQTQVNEVAGMTFAAGLRAILRQDPDIIMVGEIRDGETAETAVRAALTGHLVLTTLHTNDAVGAIPRLRDVGPDPGLISDALLGVVAQRLVRRLCPHCAEPYTPTESDLGILGISLAEANPHAWRHGRGCSHCFGSGYAGREAIIELLHVDATVRQLIYDGSLSALMDYLNQRGFDSFRKAAIAKVTTGITTIAEIRRVLPASKLAIDS
jgi:type II secretory ATPase GspE/PulE/Tfp pilus assembly ATPase PilB-like protein